MTSHVVRVNDIEMDYFTFGNGERAFVILPGVDMKSILDAAMAVQSAYRMFGEEYTVYVFDRRRNMPSPYPVRQMAADTAAVMRQIGISGADIFGASQGGMMAMCIAIDAPQLVRRMVLGSTAASSDSSIQEETDRWIALAKSGDRSALTAELVDSLYSERTIGKYRDFLIHMNDYVGEEGIGRFIIMTEAISGFDIADELKKITCPVLVIGSLGDKVLPAACSRLIAEKLGCELYLYGEEYGHCVFDEAPDYKQRILDFFHRT